MTFHFFQGKVENSDNKRQSRFALSKIQRGRYFGGRHWASTAHGVHPDRVHHMPPIKDKTSRSLWHWQVLKQENLLYKMQV